MPEVNVTYQYRSVYGNDRYYPICDNSRLICKLANKTTMSAFELNMMVLAGWCVLVKGSCGAARDRAVLAVEKAVAS